jgi:hypothetical protein
MKLLRIAFATALITAAVPLLLNQAQAQALAGWGWGWPRLVAAGTGTGNPYATAYAPTYSYATRWSYLGYGQYQPYSSSGGYGMWNNPWYSAAYHPFIRRHIPLLARTARHWQ